MHYSNVAQDGDDPSNSVTYPSTTPSGMPIPPDVQFTADELAIPANELLRLLRRQHHWALQESDELKSEMEALEQKRRVEWTAKELVLENAAEEDLTRMMRKRAEMGMSVDGLWKLREGDWDGTKGLDIKVEGEKKPWWREQWSAGEVTVPARGAHSPGGVMEVDEQERSRGMEEAYEILE